METQTKRYQVLIQHFGDKPYFAGDVRVVDNEQDAQVLIGMGLIEPLANQETNSRKEKGKS